MAEDYFLLSTIDVKDLTHGIMLLTQILTTLITIQYICIS